MSAQILIKDDHKANEVAMDKIRVDKLHEIARPVFDANMLRPYQVAGVDTGDIDSIALCLELPVSP
ncbi:hypothetical protein B0H17DRAFT_1202322 [Mycena rosella]|uniref:Uncharacterized protein n=1 Tax=Mycena rosella TaxID=1033263 RepID=A0AAD7GG42_MYCRO|nr:hypothetical protein B0H17DRAFT_1202322 [Mycena rosella]